MSKSKIEWTDYTLNFWKGCNKVSPGCDNCYMYRQAKQYGWDPTKVTRCGKAIWRQPQVKHPSGGSVYKWRDGSRVFVCSWSDFFHRQADQWRDEAWAVIRSRPGLTWIFTTKRIDRVEECLPDDFSEEKYPNVIFMPTCENQAMANERIPEALKLKVKYPWILIAVSIEPMLGAVDIGKWMPNFLRCSTASSGMCKWTGPFDGAATKVNEYGDDEEVCGECGDWAVSNPTDDEGELDWVICGGESGPGARPMHPDWARSLRDQCKAAGVPFFFKQWGEYIDSDLTEVKGNIKNAKILLLDGWAARWQDKPWNFYEFEERRGVEVVRVGKKKAGSLLDGAEYKEMP